MLPGRSAATVTVVLVLAVGLGLTAVATRAVHAAERRAQAAGADRDADRATTAVAGEMRRYRDTVAAVAASLSAHQDLTAAAFDTVTEPLESAGLAGASGVVFVVPANGGDPAEVVAAERYWRGQGAPDLRFRTVEPAVPGSTLRYLPVFGRALDGRPAAPGDDLSGSAELVGVLERARRIGGVSISEVYVLHADRRLPPGERQLSFTLAAPVFNPTSPADAADAVTTPGGHRGWVIMGLRGGDLLRETLREATQGRVDAWLTTGRGVVAGAGPATGTVVARWVSGPATDPGLVRGAVVPVADNLWWLRTQTTDAAARLDAGGGQLDTLVLGGGVAVSVLLAALLLMIMTSRSRALAAVERATADTRGAEHEARRQAALLTAVMDSISDGVGVVDETGAFLLQNPAARRLLGLDLDVDDPERWQSHYGIYRADGVTPFPTEELPLVRAIHGVESDDVELVVRPPGATRSLQLLVSARPLDPAAGVTGAVAVFHDVTGRKAAEAEVRAAEERFRFAFDHAHVGMAVNNLVPPAGPDDPRLGQFLRVNDALCAMLGYGPGELLGLTFLDVTHPDDRAAGEDLLKAHGWGDGDPSGTSTVQIEKRYLRTDGSTVWAIVNSTLIRDARGDPNYLIKQVEDVTARREETARLAAMAMQDPLTGLGNRTLMRDHLKQAVARTARTGLPIAVLFCDLDDFKPVNDTHGHAAGDELLRQFAERLRDTLRPSDTIARVGGDEFVVICEDLESEAAADEVVRRVTAAVDEPFLLPRADGSRVPLRVTVHASIGVTTVAGPGLDADEVLHRADAAMYALKRARDAVRLVRSTRPGY
jgi:diguanylate cyclase (GGDEF)-like protein/PAS domain S-box-containing protein